jgi:hypothetical protein
MVMIVKLQSSPCKQWSSTDMNQLHLSFCCQSRMMMCHPMLIHIVGDDAEPAGCCICIAAIKEESNTDTKTTSLKN